jgi:hypothetical protein
MSHFRTIRPCIIHTDERFISLSQDAKGFWLDIFSHENMTSMGLLKTSTSGLKSELSLSNREFNLRFSVLKSKDLIRYDEKTNLLWLTNYLDHCPPFSPNHIKAWGDLILHFRESPLKNEFIQYLATYIMSLPQKSFRDALPDYFNSVSARPSEALPEDLQEVMPILTTTTTTTNTTTSINDLYYDLTTVKPVQNEKTNNFIFLQTNDGGFKILPEFIDGWKKQFPAIDVDAEIAVIQNQAHLQNNLSSKSAYQFILKWLDDKNRKGATIHEFQGTHLHGKRSKKSPSVYKQVMEN